MEEKNRNKYEVRSFAGVAAPKLIEDEAGRTIEGYAVVFNSRSVQMYDYWEGRKFEEIVSPEAVTQELIKRSDIKALVEHNRERLLARSNMGVGTLKLTIDNIGLRYSFTAPNTQEGNDALELIKRGDIGGSSFAFRFHYEEDCKWTFDNERSIWTRTITNIRELFDVTITTDPAYQATSVDVRSFDALRTDEQKEEEARKQIEKYKEITSRL